MLKLDDRLAGLPGVGVVQAKKLKLLGLDTVRDLLFYFPFRYEDLTTIASSRTLTENQKITIDGELIQIENLFTRTGKKMTKALFKDSEGLIPVIWFNQPYLSKTLKQNQIYRLSGKISRFSTVLTLVSPKIEKMDSIGRPSIHSARLVPVYSECAGLTSKFFREKIALILDNLSEYPDEILPELILERRGLINIKKAIQLTHFPANGQDIVAAKKRLAYQEIFLAQIKSAQARIKWRQKQLEYELASEKFREKIDLLIQGLPFELTGAQQKVINEVLIDLGQSVPMNRLIEGDVGSGKTVVAAIAAYLVYLNGYKTTLMAPTKILAQQHFASISKLLQPFGVKAELVTSASKKSIHEDADIFIGTHALLFQRNVEKVGLTIVDEQHRFGVAQRALLKNKHGVTHFLSMTATPIPRTLALTAYGDLDLSVIDEMPPGRKTIKTWLVPYEKRGGAYNWIRDLVKKNGEQVFIVCPFIEPSESDNTVKSAVSEYQKVSKEVFPEFKTALLHGKLKNSDKDEVLLKFRAKEFDILVCTPVVEVGIDIPNASVIIIESAERFGLAQLHQLRGRVGRGGQQAYCLLFTTENNDSSARLKALESTHSGLQLAEIDLKQRGVGNIFGFEQSGRQIFKYADFTDLKLIQEARSDAISIVNNDTTLREWPYLAQAIQTEMEFLEAN